MKPCKCGSIQLRVNNPGDGRFWASCDECDAKGPEATTKALAIEAWDKMVRQAPSLPTPPDGDPQ